MSCRQIYITLIQNSVLMLYNIKFILCVLIDEDDRKCVLKQNNFALIASVSNATTIDFLKNLILLSSFLP